MTGEKWVEHIEASCGLTRPSKGGDRAKWDEAIAYHKLVDCKACNERRRTRKATIARKSREQAYTDAGLVKGRTGLGRVIWE
jgi:hypothetical protein